MESNDLSLPEAEDSTNKGFILFEQGSFILLLEGHQDRSLLILSSSENFLSGVSDEILLEGRQLITFEVLLLVFLDEVN